jgi:hypothetical protein
MRLHSDPKRPRAGHRQAGFASSDRSAAAAHGSPSLCGLSYRCSWFTSALDSTADPKLSKAGPGRSVLVDRYNLFWYIQ